METNYEKKDAERPPQQQAKQPGGEGKMAPEPVIIRDDYRGSGKLAGKIALITGGDSGIGRSAAVHFAREGADVAVVYLEEHDDAQETKRLIEAENRRCLLMSGDVTERSFCTEAVAKTVDGLGGLNILVNNAGQQYPKQEIEEIPDAQLEHIFRNNFFAYFFLAKEALKHLHEGDAIINTTSVTAFRGSGHLIDYSATKGAIVAFTRSLAKALAKKGIRVNGVAPGPIWTPLIPATFSPEHVKAFGSNTPLGRAGQPAEVGPSYVFLASADASYFTGQVLHPNGGDVME
jgi:NAD(P)-dependent dehydrogenase (short-subunit alcohol dehydrogenase family)